MHLLLARVEWMRQSFFWNFIILKEYLELFGHMLLTTAVQEDYYMIKLYYL
jgi:hypothetical protein